MAAVRVFNYEISTNSITPCNIAKGGVQGEHNATQINFNMTDELIGKLRELSGDGRTFCYRFDGYDGTGMKYSFDPEEFTPSADTPTFSFLVDNVLTRYGGTAQIYLIITLDEEDGTEMELYSYAVKLALNSTPQTDEVTGDDFNSISTLAMIAKNNAKIAEAARAVTVEAQAKTEAAKAALEKGTEWIFDGGNSETNIEIEQTFDGMMSDTSTNVVQNAVIKKYVDSKIETELQKYKDSIGDYLIKRETSGIWTYELWASGVSKCWGKIDESHEYAGAISSHFTPVTSISFTSRKAEFPANLFIEVPIVIAVAQDAGTGIATASDENSTNTQCKVVMWGTAACFGNINVYAVGRWKE